MPSDSQGVNLLISMLLAEMLDDGNAHSAPATAPKRPSVEGGPPQPGAKVPSGNRTPDDR